MPSDIVPPILNGGKALDHELGPNDNPLYEIIIEGPSSTNRHNFFVAKDLPDHYHSAMVAFNEIEAVARKIAEQTKAKAVVLFGSHARGQAGKDSDVDLLVIAESDLPRHKRSRQLHLMFKPYPFAMDILVYTPSEVEQERQFELSFISRVLREGKRLYGQAV